MGTAALPPVPDGPALRFDDYQLRLPTFEGPLDVLLRLVERERLLIAEVSLVAVTEQFMDHFSALDSRDASAISAFASVAARLVLLKSRALLPRSIVPPEEPDPNDLVRQLDEYRRVKMVAIGLADHERLGFSAFPRRAPTPGFGTERPRLAIHPPAVLAKALRRRLAVVAPLPSPAPLRPALRLQAVVAGLLRHLRPDRQLSLCSFFRHGDRELQLVAFLAVLALLRRRAVEVEQRERFGDILLVTVRPGHADRLAS